MVFSSITFLFAFLPVSLLLYGVIRRRFRNVVLLLISLVFYAYGEREHTIVILSSILINYLFGLLVEPGQPSPGKATESANGRRREFRTMCLVLCVMLNMGILGFYKYFNFFVDNVNSAFSRFDISHALPDLGKVALPLGISFFTFQALSYVIDVYRGEVKANRNPIAVGTYITMFPQLIAGPIVRYSEIEKELRHRTYSFDGFSEGVYRFCLGLAKKVMIANSLGAVADGIFALDHAQLNFQLAWMAIVSYSLQIYFDFSGYSDMAIGLGRIWGFHFPENFNYPYVSRSIREFWTRWHMTLSRWFKDYLYIPLGGNRKGDGRTYFNLLAVFVLCGFWHGAQWTFCVWGLWHGSFLILERTRLASVLAKSPRFVQHFYVFFVFTIGWTWFRAESLPQAFFLLKSMAGLNGVANIDYAVSDFNSPFVVLIAVIGILASTPILPLIEHKARAHGWLMDALKVSLATFCLILSVMSLAVGTYNPFLYFRF